MAFETRTTNLATAPQVSERRTETRVDVAMRGVVVLGQGVESFAVTLLNISEHGTMLYCGSDVIIPKNCRLMIERKDDFPPKQRICTLRWQKGAYAGLGFTTPIESDWITSL